MRLIENMSVCELRIRIDSTLSSIVSSRTRSWTVFSRHHIRFYQVDSIINGLPRLTSVDEGNLPDDRLIFEAIERIPWLSPCTCGVGTAENVNVVGCLE